jgi:hypothetical protein
MTPDKANEILL